MRGLRRLPPDHEAEESVTFDEFREKVIEAMDRHEHENEDEILDDENSLEDCAST